jgi:hypothetical protein
MHYITLIIIALLLYCGCGIGRIFNNSVVETFKIKLFNKVRKKKYDKFQRQLDKEKKQYNDMKKNTVIDIMGNSNDLDDTKPFFDGYPFFDSGPSQKLELGLSSLNNGALVKYKRKKNLNPYNFRSYKKTYPRKSGAIPSKPGYNKLYF